MKVGLEIFPLICYNWKETERSGVFGSKRGEYPLKGREEYDAVRQNPETARGAGG